MKSLSRPTALKIAALLSLLMSSVSIVNTLPLLARGSTAVAQSTDSPPYVVLMVALLLGVVGVIGAYGAWTQQRWGIVLTIIANLLNGLSAAPGILFAPQPGMMALAITTVIFTILIVVFCLWRERKPTAA